MLVKSLGSVAICAASYGATFLGAAVVYSTGASVGVVVGVAGAAVSVGRCVKYVFDVMQCEKDEQEIKNYKNKTFWWVVGASLFSATTTAAGVVLHVGVHILSIGSAAIIKTFMINKYLSKRDALYLKREELKDRHICQIQ